MNLFAFYRDAVLAYLGKPTLSQADVENLTIEANKIKNAYWKHDPIDYSAGGARLAYMLYYAPKHAIMWREYIANAAYSFASPMHINSIGTACGSEIIGLMEGLGETRPAESNWLCLDIEPLWEPLLQAAKSLYEARRNCVMHCTSVGALADLRPQAFTIGSLVLSEIVKQKDHRQFRPDVAGIIGPATGLFLDIAVCTMSDGSARYLSDFYPFGFESLRNKGWNMRATINAEISGCNPGWCLDKLSSEPGMMMFFAQFT
jgi:hypothetical protein